jgi:hypothetical protein
MVEMDMFNKIRLCIGRPEFLFPQANGNVGFDSLNLFS